MEQNRKVTDMKKKIVLAISLCMFVLGFAACGEDPKKVDYNGTSYDQLESTSENLATALVGLSDEEMGKYNSDNADDITFKLVSKWKELKPDVGEYKELGDFSIEKSGKTLTTTHILDFSKRDLTLTCVYSYLDMQISDVTLEENYSLGETMQKAAMNTLMGLGTVFLILILISLIIYGFKVIPYLQQRAEMKKAEQTPQAGTVRTAPQAAPVPMAVPQSEPKQDEYELAAVIAAAIAAAQGVSQDGFVVRSIRRRR